MGPAAMISMVMA
jgi:hypothetical protein